MELWGSPMLDAGPVPLTGARMVAPPELPPCMGQVSEREMRQMRQRVAEGSALKHSTINMAAHELARVARILHGGIDDDSDDSQ